MTSLLAMSITGGVMILVIALLRALLQNRLHRTVILTLWFLALLRLTVPVFVDSPASVYNLLPKEETQTVSLQINEQETVSVPIENVGIVVSKDGVPVYVDTSEERSNVDIYPLIWAAGAMLCLAFFMIVHVRARLQYRFAIPEEGNDHIGRIKIKRLDSITAPLVYGLFSPVILLPSGFPIRGSEEYEHVLQHELRHVRNGDLWGKLIVLLVTCVHWFNPCVWLMLYLVSQDMEMRCDAQVIRLLGEKKAYAATLVRAEVSQLNHLVETCFAFSATEKRIKAIAKAKVHLLRSTLCCTVFIVIVLFCFATEPKKAAASVAESSEPITAYMPSSSIILTTTLQNEKTTYEAVYSELQTSEVQTETRESMPDTAQPKPTLQPYKTTEPEPETSTYYFDYSAYEEYGSSVEVLMKEDGKKTISLRLPDYAYYTVSVDENPLKEKDFPVNTWYDYENDLYYFEMKAYNFGRATIAIYIGNTLWMKLHISILHRNYESGWNNYMAPTTESPWNTVIEIWPQYGSGW